MERRERAGEVNRLLGQAIHVERARAAAEERGLTLTQVVESAAEAGLAAHAVTAKPPSTIRRWRHVGG